MKKILTTLLSMVLVAALSIGGTLAYLTMSTQTENNVFTVGDISIALEEVVEVIGEGGKVSKTEVGAEYTKVMPGDYLKKEVTVTNDGTEDAYVAVTVTMNNVLEINKAIDEVYGDENAQKMYDYIFDGWGLNHSKDLNEDGIADAGMRLTITGDDMPEHVLHVDSVKTIDNYALFYTGNWFGDQEDVIPFDEYYTVDMQPYEFKYTYYAFLPAGESTTLFKGLNVPAEFTKEQLKMFSGLEINVTAAAIQADNMGIASQYADDENSKAKTAFAILHGDIDEEDLNVNNTPKTITVEGNNKAALDAAIVEAKAGDIVLLSEDTSVQSVTIDKAVVLDLNNKTLTTDAWGGVLLKNGASLKNGTINHINTVAAIKAWNVKSIENVTINITKTSANNNITGIAVQEGAHNKVQEIKNVTINGASQGVEVKYGSSVDYMENVEINAKSINANKGTALMIDAGNIGKAVNCTFNGEVYGVHMFLRGENQVGLELIDSDVSGTDAALYAHDESGISNTTNCSLTLTYDDATTFTGPFTWNFEDECQSVVKLIQK